MVLLVERLLEDDLRLIYSLSVSGYQFQTVVIEYDGFLMDYMISPYSYFIYGEEEPEENPLYFNRIAVPEYWDIQGTGSGGEIYDFDDLRGRIFFAEPKKKRYVRTVEWLDGNRRVCSCDHYDKFGRRFAQTSFDRSQKPVHRTFYDGSGAEVITENLLTGDIILTENGKNRFFCSREEFVVHFLRQLEPDYILYNSLSVPFLAAARYCRQVKQLRHNILFWQEPVGEDIPGNMKMILNRDMAGTDLIAVQSKKAFQRIRELEIDQSRFSYLGYIYPEARQNQGSANALIFTNSDQIERLEELVLQLPEIRFHIGALTEMSPKLMNMQKFPNVCLFPAISEEQIRDLWQKCDIYLDINHGNEVQTAVQTAFIQQDLIFAFENTAHNRRYVGDGNLFSPDQYTEMAEKLRMAVSDPAVMERELGLQRSHAESVTAEDYRTVIGSREVADGEEKQSV
ncbi:MAG: accessory Sec system glycosylation chaperone GtfB [Clostridiales bacterium]|nr:accessory Sec system glycosylation chaperone GtfB [Clostridiales bacterium]